ncbi:guanitoxin biosynthesis heme-dependent pre-guanitoxin N-hydroxylase GntA [Chondromyces apiculatus]|uniref:DUF1989 domain-containing protein n=1 Tax=Chondromyces apiculatus DSM 436 TaxID=1192034 RepID=A0A017T772_9BACT|nr:guanitoxin biosynthesis heme-dependent pre-guanitoxin N-hydroxylase GntA [Chondromyces apiculatus]EYF05054.1 Hypothetical protein CAP_3644 [Chondromyces apiculatus DSM 436]
MIDAPRSPVAPASPRISGRYYRPAIDHPERLQPAWEDAERVPHDVQGADLTAAAMHGAFRAFVLDPHYTCLGAKSAVNSGSYRLGLYDALGSPTATAALARDLASFSQQIDEISAAFATFVAIFEKPLDTDEETFERALWAQLQALHEADRAPWDLDVSSDPDDPHFSYSFAGRAFFIVGLHPGSERLSRKFPWPALVFNPHMQFERLRAEGKYGRMQQMIRTKEVELQGDINPVLRDFGEQSEARQYSGRAVEPGWHPPFHLHDSQDAPADVAHEHADPKVAGAITGCPFLAGGAGATPLQTASPSGQTPRADAEGAPLALSGDRPRPGVRYRIPPHSGVSFLIDAGQTLRVIDPTGKQVSDLYSVRLDDRREYLSGGRSIDYADTLYLTRGHILYSNRSNPMWTITRDDVGRHDFVLTPCSPEMYRKLRGDDGSHPSCFENLRIPMERFGVEGDRIGSTFNIFMDVSFDPRTGKMTIAPPPSRAGDAIELRAEAAMIVGLTACSSEVTNDGSLKPIDFEILDGFTSLDAPA